MKHLLLTAIAAVVLVGCATTQSPEPLISKAPDISIHEAVASGNIEPIKQHLADGADVNATDEVGWTPLHRAVIGSHTDHTETAEFLIANGADVNARNAIGWTPMFESLHPLKYS
jgi:ankyrin repeat protein